MKSVIMEIICSKFKFDVCITNNNILGYGNLTIKNPSGNTTHRSKVKAFCRCGQSNNNLIVIAHLSKLDLKGKSYVCGDDQWH